MKLADLKAGLAKAAPRLRSPAVDLVGIVGFGLVVAGLDLVSRPLALIVAGVVLVCAATLLQRRQP